MGAHGGLRLRARPRPRWALSRPLYPPCSRAVARRIRSWKRQGCDVYVYFDNDQKSAAPADAAKLKAML
ncbi:MULTISPECIES: DUF72 domain-containing protein [unclassified Bradyrhizobium]|uniref:DUF72 domain-containing protein n=1 Tax=unclassified Bradyrhizobium TaxID=2631580 RepID=UPI0020B36CC1|nr:MULTISPECIES: DUF72 domain-containing protein [unclassified Bradyrhizobium]MCP3402056.1 DUF72 domain-containing protein [Bradyrhizobium sp. CCGB20]MCP3410543.1 DUF72 domain-containing protein [Bradyrhizobium sp. CCGB01]